SVYRSRHLAPSLAERYHASVRRVQLTGERRIRRVQIARGRPGRAPQGVFLRRNQGDTEARTDHLPLLYSGLVRCREMGRRSHAAHPGTREAEARGEVRRLLLI